MEPLKDKSNNTQPQTWLAEEKLHTPQKYNQQYRNHGIKWHLTFPEAIDT